MVKEMEVPASLVLEDGSVFEGYAFGSIRPTLGELVFNTSMTGYQEILTDPSYAGQIVMPTYPLIGNYGINARDFESRRVQVSGFVVREHCLRPSHSMSTSSLDQFLADQGVPGISGVDTRAITRLLRSRGVIMGAISINESVGEALARLHKAPSYDDIDFASGVSATTSYNWPSPSTSCENPLVKHRRIVVDDYGLKYNILRTLQSKGCEVIVMPAGATASDVLERNPDGVVLSPGPGNPELLGYAVSTARGLLGHVPILGICLGNQVLGLAFGGKTFKLKFGHRGGNHPVRDQRTGRVHITAQNHGYAIDPESLPPEVEVSHINLNDGTVEGLRHSSLPAMSIQYHSEASPGPQDNEYIFDEFLTSIDYSKK